MNPVFVSVLLVFWVFWWLITLFSLVFLYQAIKSLKSVDIKQLQSKYETFIKEIEAKLEYDEEINDLEKRNQKLTAKLNELETIMPILSERIADLDDINRNLVSNKCFSKSRLVLEDSEVKNIWVGVKPLRYKK